jgi:two-component system OmpR family response regulator
MTAHHPAGAPDRRELPPFPDARILVVDDESDIADLLAAGLRFAGFDVRTAGCGADAFAAALDFRPHALVLDVMLPDIGGFELCRQLRSSREDIGVIFLTARDATEDAITGLVAGGDDYISKPFSVDEVVARLRAVLRRVPASAGGAARPMDDGVFRLADLELDEPHHEVRRGDQLIDLSPTEFAVLRYLLENSGRVLSKPQILAAVWRDDFRGDSGIVESYISVLRKKLDCFDPPLIHTLRGVGYSVRIVPSSTPTAVR